MAATRKPVDRSVMTCPFTVVIDTREQIPYAFRHFRSNKADHEALIDVPIVRAGLPIGDYSIVGYEPALPPQDMPQVAIERKSKSDLYGSVARRENFVGRLERMAHLRYAAVMVEAELSEILREPPEHSRLDPKSLHRTLLAWMQRYPVRWHFYSGRACAEAATFRILERFYLDHSKDSQP